MPFDASSLGSPRTDLGGDTVIINEPPGAYAPAFARRGAVSRGKERTTIEITSEPLLFDLDDLALGVKPSAVIRDVLEKEIKNISEVASPETLERRERAKRTLEGSPSDVAVARRKKVPYRKGYEKRYAGGRTGLKMPGQTVRLFNDSGRLAEGVFVRENKEDRSWTTNVTANRLDPVEFAGDKFQWMLNKLRSLVPMLQDARTLLSNADFNKAVSEALDDLVVKGTMAGDAREAAKLRQLANAKKQAARAALALGRAFLGV